MKKFYHSLVFKIIFFALMLVALGTTVRLLVVNTWLQDEVTTLVNKHHLALATQVASGIDNSILERKKLLESMAQRFPIHLIGKYDKLNSWLKEHQEISPFFDIGYIVVATSGKGLIAQYPVSSGKEMADYSSSDWFVRTKETLSATIGKPFAMRENNQPAIILSAPIFDTHGSLVAILAGISPLNKTGFLDSVYNGHIGESGGYLVISPRDNLFVASSKPEMVLKPTPKKGINPLHDKAMDGYRGAGATVNADGVEELVGIIDVPSAGWFVVARMPAIEAHKPISKLSETILISGIFVAILAVTIATIILRVLLAPLRRSAFAMRQMAAGEIERDRLPISSKDEVGDLIDGYNSLIDRVKEDERVLEKKVKEAVDAVMRIEEENREKERQIIQQSKMAMMGNMIGAIAHQLKQPLNSLSAGLYNMQDELEDEDITKEKFGEFSDSSLKQIRYMSETITDFRNFFKPQKQMSPFFADLTINAVMRILNQQMKLLSIRVEFIYDSMLSLFGYENDFKQAVMNIIKNSMDALEERKIADPKIKISISLESENFKIEISDNAGGIPEELLPDKLFEEYVSTKGEMGTGIGLSITKMILEQQLGYELRASNSADGAVFVISGKQHL